MKKLFLTFGLLAGALLTTNAQEAKTCCKSGETKSCHSDAANTQGDWYLGTTDISGVPWTQWALNPTVGYAFTDNIVVGASLLQGTELDVDGEVTAGDLNMDLYARYFFKDFYGHVGTQNLTTDFGLNAGVGMLVNTGVSGLYVDPNVVYNTTTGTTNLRLGLGLRF